MLRNGVLFLIAMRHEKKRLSSCDESENGSGFFNTVRADPDADFSDLHHSITFDSFYLPVGILLHGRSSNDSLGAGIRQHEGRTA